jgi:putative endonuclease
VPPERRYWVYILGNHSRTLYIGMTNDLHRRIGQHAEHAGSEFAARYDVDQLVYFEEYFSARDAIERAKELKGWRREKKIALIEQTNPHWDNLTPSVLG